jgi:hypothetical protein
MRLYRSSISLFIFRYENEITNLKMKWFVLSIIPLVVHFSKPPTCRFAHAPGRRTAVQYIWLYYGIIVLYNCIVLYCTILIVLNCILVWLCYTLLYPIYYVFEIELSSLPSCFRHLHEYFSNKIKPHQVWLVIHVFMELLNHTQLQAQVNPNILLDLNNLSRWQPIVWLKQFK